MSFSSSEHVTMKKYVHFTLRIPRLADRQREELLRTSLSQLYGTLDTFASKLCNHEYEFAHLPLTLKTPLPEAGKEAINKLPAAYSGCCSAPYCICICCFI